MSKKAIFEKYTKITGSLPPIIIGIENKELQEIVQLVIAESYIDGFKKGKKVYKRFKSKFLEERIEKEKLQEEIEKLKIDNESLQEKQIASMNRFGFVNVLDKALNTKENKDGDFE